MLTTDDRTEREALLELPPRLETSAFWSPVVVSLTQGALALNAADVGGSQMASAGNVATVGISIS